MTRSRSLLLGLALSGACAAAVSAQELLVPAGSASPPPIAGVAEPAPLPAAASFPATSFATPVPSGTVLTPIPEEMPATVRISDCPQSGPVVGTGVVANNGRRKCAPPSTGWYPPGVIAMNRMWVPYHKFFPNAWTGQPPAPQVRLPMIYMPTDTTQLGYYYQHVPHWHAYADMIPPVPRPVDWHRQYRTAALEAPTYQVVPSTQLGEPQPVPSPSNQSPAPPPPPQTDLEKSAAAPELLPLMR